MGQLRERRDLFAITLVLTLLTATFITAAPEGDAAKLLTVAMLAATLVAAVTASGAGAPILAAAWLLGLVALAVAVAGVSSSAAPTTLPRILSVVLVTVAPLALARGVLTEVRTYGVTLQTVFGAIAIYLLVGMLFSNLIGAVASIDQADYFGARGDGTSSERLYFSFVTLATLGYGDFVPATQVGRSLAMLEGVLGQLYLVTIVSLLVGNMGRRRGDPAKT